MAYNLEARLTLIDRLSRPLDRIKKAMKASDDTVKKASKSLGSYRDAAGRLRDATGRFVAENNKLASSFKGIGASIGGLRSGFLGLASAIGGAYAAKKAFDLTIGAAAHREMNVVTMEAMFNDTSKAGRFFDFIEKRAAESMFSEADFFSSTRGFVTVSKDIDTLQKMVGIQERLAAYDPIQGLEGASFALRELFSGDGVSMVERFELPRTVINEIKKMDLPDQLTALDRVLNKMGISQELLDKQDATALAQYTQGIDKLRLGLMKAGQQGLEKIKPMLVDFNEMLDGPGFQKFVDFGSDLLGGMMQGVVDGVDRAKRYVETHFINNPAFNNLPDVKSKVLFVIDDLMKTFNDWLASDGSAKINEAAATLTTTLSTALQNSAPKIVTAAIEFGEALGGGIVEGIKKRIDKSPYSALFTGALAGGAGGRLFGAPGMIVGALGGGAAGVAQHYTNKTIDAAKGAGLADKTYGVLEKIGFDKAADFLYNPANYAPWTKPDGSHATGLSRVPRDGYVATLHRDEQVLTKGQADERRRGGGGVSVTVNTGPVTVRQESDIDAIARGLVREMKRLGGVAFAG
jgi:hypothetical protein